MFIGMIDVIFTAILSRSPATVGAIIFPSPLPIILGAESYSIWVIMITIILTVLGVILFLKS